MTAIGNVTRQGFTGHEHLDNLGLIHMNGRVQDPHLGRFFSVDPLVQAPDSSQSLNRYSYVWNNPLSMVDPSGFAAAVYAGDMPSNDRIVEGVKEVLAYQAEIETMTVAASRLKCTSGFECIDGIGARNALSDLEKEESRRREWEDSQRAASQSNFWGAIWNSFVEIHSVPGENMCGADGEARYPNNLGGVSINAVCGAHDQCYGTYGASRAACDADFRAGVQVEFRAQGVIRYPVGL